MKASKSEKRRVWIELHRKKWIYQLLCDELNVRGIKIFYDDWALIYDSRDKCYSKAEVKRVL